MDTPSSINKPVKPRAPLYTPSATQNSAATAVMSTISNYIIQILRNDRPTDLSRTHEELLFLKKLEETQMYSFYRQHNVNKN